MKGRNPKRKPTSTIPKQGKKNQSTTTSTHEKNPKRRKNDDKKDSFFMEEEEIESDMSDKDEDFDGINGVFSDDEGKGSSDGDGDGDGDEKEEEEETAEQVKRRMALQLLEKVRKMEREDREEFDGVEDREEKDGARDSNVRNLLLKQQLEDSGRARRFIASKVQIPETEAKPRLLLKHRQSVTAVALSDDDSRGFSASKDGCIVHWDVETGKADKYLWPADDVLQFHGLRNPNGSRKKHSKQVLALAITSDGRYLATGGFDRHVHLWDTRSREHLKAFSGHKKLVSCLAFREGTSELFSGSYDREPKIWNAEDRTYVGSLHGHHSEVVSISCLRKERALTAGRDRQLCYWQIPEEKHFALRSSASSLESCCFVANDEFLSGNDDGSIQLWSATRKKPVCIVRNAHSLTSNEHLDGESNEAHAPSSSARSWVGAVSVCRNSDFAASGAGNGFIRLWAIESEAREIRPLFGVPV